MFDKAGRGIITWRELSSLLKALGIPDIPQSLLTRMLTSPANEGHRSGPNPRPTSGSPKPGHLGPTTPTGGPKPGLLGPTPPTVRAQTPAFEFKTGLDYKAFLMLLHAESFETSLDYTFNRHNSTYNIRVIKKAVSLLVDGILTLEDLRSARLGFTLYEGETCNGIQLELASVSAAMRVTGKAIAPKKLQVWLDTIEEDVPGRLQFYEFLDLVKLCNDRTEQTKAMPSVSTSVERSKLGLFELTDPGFLLTPGQKLSKHMDEEYDNMVSTINSQAPPRETLSSAKKSASSPDFHNDLSVSRKSKRAEEGLDLYGQIRDSLKSSTSQVQSTRASSSTGKSISRPHSVAMKSRLPALPISSSLHERSRRSTSAPSMRSLESNQRTSRVLDTESVPRESLARHLTASAPLVRGGFVKDKTEAFDEGEFALPERRIENYDTLRDYIVTNGEAGLSKVVTSSIGASHKQSSHTSPPSSPPFSKMEERKKKPKPKRAFEDGRKNLKSQPPICKDHRFSVDALSNNLEDIINSSKPYTPDLTKATSTRKTSSHFDSDTEIPPRPRTESPLRNITFNLNTGD